LRNNHDQQLGQPPGLLTNQEKIDMNDMSTTTPALTPEEEREERRWTKLFDKHGIPHEQRDGWRKMLEKRYPPRPRKPRSEPAVLEAATARISGIVNDTPPGQGLPPVDALMKTVGLDPTNRADAAYIRHFLRESDQLTYIPPIKRQFVRFIAHSSDGEQR
jgi:hypothetical protein